MAKRGNVRALRVRPHYSRHGLISCPDHRGIDNKIVFFHHLTHRRHRALSYLLGLEHVNCKSCLFKRGTEICVGLAVLGGVAVTVKRTEEHSRKTLGSYGEDPLLFLYKSDRLCRTLVAPALVFGI